MCVCVCVRESESVWERVSVWVRDRVSDGVCVSVDVKKRIREEVTKADKD